MVANSTLPTDCLDPGLNPAQSRGWALEAGFSEAGLVALPHGADARDAERYEGWVEGGNAGAMRYLERRDETGELLRARVGTPFPWARSAIVCFAGYRSGEPLSTEPADAGAGWIARYAWTSRVDGEGRRRPSDYHKVLKKRLKALEARIRRRGRGSLRLEGMWIRGRWWSGRWLWRRGWAGRERILA